MRGFLHVTLHRSELGSYFSIKYQHGEDHIHIKEYHAHRNNVKILKTYCVSHCHRNISETYILKRHTDDSRPLTLNYARHHVQGSGDHVQPISFEGVILMGSSSSKYRYRERQPRLLWITICPNSIKYD